MSWRRSQSGGAVANVHVAEIGHQARTYNMNLMRLSMVLFSVLDLNACVSSSVWLPEVRYHTYVANPMSWFSYLNDYSGFNCFS